MIDNVEKLLESIAPALTGNTIPVPTFYAVIDIRNLKIIAVGPLQTDAPGVFALKIDQDVAEKFLTGEENPDTWSVGYKNDQYEIAKITTRQQFFYSRVEVLPIIQIPNGEVEGHCDVEIVVDSDSDTVSIKYDGDLVLSRGNVLKFYLTREDDPSHLKAAITLNEATLNKIMDFNNLSEWPNPMIFNMPDGVDDISAFTVKSDLVVSYIKQ